MITRKTAAATTAGALLAAGAMTLTTAATQAAQPRAGSFSARYVAHDIKGDFAMADIADPKGGGPDIGDLMAFTQRLTRKGHTVGRVSNVAVGVDHRRHLFHSTGTLHLAHGTVEFGGLVSQTSTFTLAVTGGTGRYRGAAGTLRFTLKGQRQILTLTLQR